jgi:hypothetical protein
LLARFAKENEAGQRSTGGGIKAALEKQLGHRVAKTTAYRLLKRHRWRKVVPRPYHPAGTAEKQETFKKTSPTRWVVFLYFADKSPA